MTWTERLLSLLRPIVYLAANPVTLLGAVLTTSAAFTLIGFWAFEIISGEPTHPYAGIFLFLILPGFFVAGLVLMPVGELWQRRRLSQAGKLPSVFPKLDLNAPFLRNAALLVLIATTLNVVILATATYKGVHHMDSVQFCGTACHTVMQPEYTAYVDSPHSRVACVQCHIGPGADWFVRSKLSGTRQVFAVALETYSRPIPSPVEHLRPARETCEQCHWPQKFHGDKLVVRRHYLDDEANTEEVTVLMLRIGGEGTDGHVGIHGRHLDPERPIEYLGLDGRREIPKVFHREENGELTEFVTPEAAESPERLAQAERRVMDCMDCHNRPSHSFALPEPEVDEAIAAGGISRELPYVRREAVRLLREEYPDRDTAVARIKEGLQAFYQAEYPGIWRERPGQVQAAASRVADIYLRNVFPKMNVTWGSYPNHIGHEGFPGCFRCHDDRHESADGRVIAQDCDTCHAVLAMQEEAPPILEELGL